MNLLYKALLSRSDYAGTPEDQAELIVAYYAGKISSKQLDIALGREGHPHNLLQSIAILTHSLIKHGYLKIEAAK